MNTAANEEELTEEEQELQAIEEGLNEAFEKEETPSDPLSEEPDAEAEPEEAETSVEEDEETSAEEEEISDEQEVSPESDETAPEEDDNSSYPGTWSNDERELFASLPSEAKEVVLRRTAALQGDLTRESQKRAYIEKQMQPMQQHVETLEGIVSPHRHLWEGLDGVDDYKIINNLLAAQAVIESDPIAGVWHILDTKGLVPEDLYEDSDRSHGGNGRGRELDPEVQRLHARLDAQERERQENQKKSQEESARQAREASERELQQFAYEQDGKGEYLRPFLADENLQQEVAEDMAVKITALKQSHPWLSQKDLLEQSYDFAIWANPKTREVLQKQNHSPNGASPKNDVSRKKKAGSSVRGSQGQTPSVEKKVPEDLNKVLEMVMDGELT